MRKWLWLIGVTLLLIILFVYNRQASAPECYVNPGLKTTEITGENTVVTAEVASLSQDQVRGLSGRDCLGQNRGMLFVYELTGDYCFWMKDMKFAIDMIWLDDEKKIVTVKDHARPESYPEEFCPDKPAKYVLEVNSGFVRTAGWVVGAQLQWQ